METQILRTAQPNALLPSTPIPTTIYASNLLIVLLAITQITRLISASKIAQQARIPSETASLINALKLVPMEHMEIHQQDSAPHLALARGSIKIPHPTGAFKNAHRCRTSMPYQLQ